MDVRVLALGVARMADALGNSFLIVVLPLYVASREITGHFLGLDEPMVAGLVLGLFGLVSAAGQPLAGRLSDRMGRRKAFVILGLLVFAGANYAFSHVDSHGGLLVVRAVQGLAAAFTITAGVALVNELSRRDTRGGNMGVYNSLRLIGFGTGPLLAGLIMEAGPYHLPFLQGPVTGFEASFYLAAAAALVSAGLVQVMVQDPPETRPTRERLAVRILAPGEGAGLDPVFTLGLATFIMSACIALLSPIEPEINARLGQGPLLFAVEFSALIAALAVVQPLVGRWSDRAGRKAFIVAGLVALVPTTLAQGLVTVPWAMIVARLLQGVGAAMVLAPGLALAGDLARKGQSGAQLSVLTVAFGLGISLGQVASGWLVRFGIAAPFLFGSLLAVAGTELVRRYVRPPDGSG